MKIKVTDLKELKEVPAESYLIVDDGAKTNKVSKDNLLKEVNDEIENLKSSVSDGKELLASAITDGGLKTSKDDTFQLMANNIRILCGETPEEPETPPVDPEEPDTPVKPDPDPEPEPEPVLQGPTLTFSFNNNTPGNAYGTIKLQNTKSDYIGNYSIRWADANGKISEYEAITTMELSSSSSTRTYDFLYHNAIPEEATRVVAMKDDVISASFTIPKSKRLSGKLFSYGSISDLHLDGDGSEKHASYSDLKKEIDYFISKGAVAVCNSGDITSDGRRCDIDLAKKVKSRAEAGGMKFYSVRGNHDNMGDCSSGGGIFKEVEPNGNLYKKEINGEIFIFLSMISKDAGSSSLFSSDQITQLKSWLEQYKDRRVFLYEHVFVTTEPGNIKRLYPYASMSSSGNAGKFKELLKKYTNIILFTGHSHLDFKLQRFGKNANVFQGTSSDCSKVHCPSASKPRRNDGSGSADDTYTYNEGAEGYLVDVYPTCIVLKGRDFIKVKNLPSATYILQTKAGGNGTGGDGGGTVVAPSGPSKFPANQSLLFHVDAGSSENTSTQAKDLSGNGHNFDINNVSISNGRFIFGGKDSHSYLQNSALKLTDSNDPKNYTFEFVARIDGYRSSTEPNAGYIFAMGTSSPERISFLPFDFKYDLYTFKSGSSVTTTMEAEVTVGTEHHFALVINGAKSSVTLYRDGVSIFSDSGIDINWNVQPSFVIGGKYNLNGESFNGAIKYFKLFAYAMTEAQVQEAYNASK